MKVLCLLPHAILARICQASLYAALAWPFISWRQQLGFVDVEWQFETTE